MSPAVVLVLAKRPEAGRVKTRLAATLGDPATTRLAHAFTLDTLRAAARVDAATCHVAYAPADAGGWFRHHAPRAVLHRQPERDLGARMAAGFAAAFAAGATRVVCVGTDTPHVSSARLRAALDTLDSADICVGPAEDGGYYLIGMRRLHPPLFEAMPWSTPDVLPATRARAAALGLALVELERDVDVDDAPSLRRFAARLADLADPDAAPVTRRALRELGLAAPEVTRTGS